MWTNYTGLGVWLLVAIFVESIVAQSQTLTRINHAARPDDFVEINLARSRENGTCYLLYPRDHNNPHLIDEIQDDSVEVREPNSFVSCRAVIGPLNDELLGDWTIYEEFPDGSQRRQPHLIAFASTPYDVTPLDPLRTVTNYGGSFFYAVRRTGDVQTCILILPDKTELVVTSSTQYPGIRGLNSNSNFGCIMSLGPVHQEMIGDFTLVGRYNNRGILLEFRQPTTTFLYDEERPYDQAYNVTTNSTQIYAVNPYAILPVNVTSTGTVMGCYLDIPGENRMQLNSAFSYPGIQIVSIASGACRIRITHFEENQKFFDKWMFVGKFFNRNVYSEIRMPFNIILEDPDDPIPDTGRDVSNLNSLLFQLRNGEQISPTIAVTSSRITDSCNLRTPSGKQFVLLEGADRWMDEFSYPGIQIINPTSRIACAVTIGPLSHHHNGEWVLISRESRNGNRFERRMAFQLFVGVGFNLPAITHRVNAGSNIDIYVNQTGNTDSCHLRFPDDNIEELNSNFNHEGVTVHQSSRFVSCRVTIGPINENSLGRWVIGDRKPDRWEIRQPVNIEWMYPDTPESEIYRVTTNTTIDYVTNFGATMFPSVRRTGEVQSVHIITPDGSDLMISNSHLFPGMRWVNSNSNFAVILALGPVDREMLGDWTLYARILNQGLLHEIRQPFRMYLYNENNPNEQAYNTTMLNPTNNIVSMQASFDVGVTGSGTRDGCVMITPDGQFVNLLTGDGYPGVTVINTGSQVVCRVTMGPVTEDLLGNWTLIGKFSNRNIFTEFRQPFSIIEEDPKNPIEEDRTIENLSRRTFNMKAGERTDVSLDVFNSRATDSCHLRFPNGLQFVLVDGFSSEGIQIIPTTSRLSCGVTFNPILATMAGEWMLIARESRSGNLFERRQPFLMQVEAPIPAIPRDTLTMLSGNDFYLRLHDPASDYDNCELTTPRNIDETRIEKDRRHEKYCGYVVRNVTSADNGEWALTYGSILTLKATVTLTVVDALTDTDNEPQSVIFPLGRQTRTYLGPENARFCRVEDPEGLVHFDNFGRCEINLDVVTKAHEGFWTLNVGLPGRLTTKEIYYEVTAKETDPPNRIVTTVEKVQHEVFLTCSVLTEHEFVDCSFENPHSKIIIPSAGIGESRYSSHGSGIITTESGMNRMECNIRINEPLVEDLGIWRCSIETSQTTLYGFLTVLCPWAMMDEEVAASVVSEPELKPTVSTVAAVVDEPLTISCSLAASIRYCWFRSEDGTIYSVTPDINHEGYGYVGAGFEAGECGVRLHSSSKSHAGRWSCHVGLREVPNAADQVANIQVTVADWPIQTNVLNSHGGGDLTIETWSYNRSSIDYCRFIRHDGFALNTDSDVEGFKTHGTLSEGFCAVTINDPTAIDFEAWTVAIKLSARNGEILTLIYPSGVAAETTTPRIPDGTETEPKPEVTPAPEVSPEPETERPPRNPGASWWPTILVCTSSITLSIAILVIVMNSKKPNKAYTWIRNSFRKSFAKKKLVSNEQPVAVLPP